MKHIYLLFSVMALSSCNSNPKIDVQGHRGCRGLYPENSLPAFQKAIELGVQTLELDLAISKDKKVVVSHDPFMNHEFTLDVKGNDIPEEAELSYKLYTMTYDSIKMYDCGSKAYPRFPNQKKLKVYKPLLEEVIDLAEAQTQHAIFYNIEIKSLPEWDDVFTPKVDEFVALALDIINTKGIANRTTLQSFDVRALEVIKRVAPKQKTSLLVDENESINDKLKLLSFKPDIISPYFELIDAERIKKLHAKGFKVIPWTLNTEQDINAMIDYNVDGIISDYPDRVIHLLKVR
ncbi:glycerophosphodiester phosphodiesterase [Flavobacteriaceae bacterium LMO-SS05]